MFFFITFSTENKFDKAMTDATNSSRMDRLRDLQDMSGSANISKYPLVPQVISALDNFSGEEVLYIQMRSAMDVDYSAETDMTEAEGPETPMHYFPSGSKYIVFFYEGYTPNDFGGSSTTTNVDWMRATATPIQLAQEHLYHYAQCRCHVKIIEPEHDKNWSAIILTLYNDTEVLE